MELDKKVFKVHHNHDLSFFRLTNITSFEDANIILIDFNALDNISDTEVDQYINSNKMIYIDSTYELLENSVLEKLDRFPKLDSIHYFYNPRSDSYSRALLSKLRQKGLTCVPEQYFIKCANFYQPNINNTPMPKKSYLCLTGKVNPSRTFLISLLSKYNLLEHGYVSYFGEHYTAENFSSEIIDNYRDAHFLSPLSKSFIRDELKKMNLPLVADTTHFSYKISHTKEFNAALYNAVDFVIVPETTGCTMNGNFFPTEKTIKCINLNKKFIPIASKGFIKNLKKYYKDNFNKDISNLTDWCDTSFDDIISLEERIKRVVKSAANEISNYSKNNLKDVK